MRAEAKKQLLEALRSGRYNQDTRALRTNNGFCCLGVLCHISNVGKWTPDNLYSTGSETQKDFLPKEVCEWAGLDPWVDEPTIKLDEADAKRYLLPENSIVSLNYLNDSGVSFIDIANLIEKYIPITEGSQHS